MAWVDTPPMPTGVIGSPVRKYRSVISKQQSEPIAADTALRTLNIAEGYIGIRASFASVRPAPSCVHAAAEVAHDPEHGNIWDHGNCEPWERGLMREDELARTVPEEIDEAAVDDRHDSPPAGLRGIGAR
ncbi:hypothetical protein [Methylobacterium sp. AMS5]|uniref:hypothetical protein n=1 Tax=Methylobacterium sp. AMS5 TaxID=925818 RepID=UPI0011874C61|nr:hypothetical protein [Methylobacterium sp. AMS5]